jgi:hypothetical protein
MHERRSARLRPEFTAATRCPQCGETNTLEVAPANRPLNVVRARAHCACGRTYAVDLERRSGVRKHLTLHGHYRRRGDRTPRPMTIRNVSRSGLMFEPDDGRPLRLGERIEVHFSFGQPAMTYVHRQVKILRQEEAAFGAVFSAGRQRHPLTPSEDLALALHTPDIRTL